MTRLGALILAVGLMLCSCSAASDQTPQGSGDEGLTVYFNDPLAGLGGIEGKLIEFIGSAGERLDLALYHLSASELIEALGRACRRGVKIRMILEAEQAEPKALPACIDLKLDRNERLMHHKFAVADGQKVWTGSTNWTEMSLNFDANSSLVIESHEVARAYESEFEEMFAGGRYGTEKRDTNRERFKIGEIALEVYFSPSDRPRERLLELIGAAKDSIKIALYTLTDDPLYEALLSVRARGVRIGAIWDFLGSGACFFSEVDELLKEGIGTLDALPGLLHHKYAVIDDKIVITGSANWSRSGLERNDENILIIHDEEVASSFSANFELLLEDARAYERGEGPPRLEVRHFEPVRGGVLILWRPPAPGAVERYEICRLSLSESSECERVYQVPGWAWYFVDRDVSAGRVYSYRARSLIDGEWSDYSNIYSAQAPQEIPLLTAEEAERLLDQYKGETVTVRFVVANDPRPMGEAGHVYLNAGDDYKTDFTAFIPGCALERFIGSGLDLFALKGHTVEVTGELDEYNGPEIIVTGPWQISVLD